MKSRFFAWLRRVSTNVARHARASAVSIELTQDTTQIVLRIHDNGQGYEVAQRHAGLGIGGMHERLSLLNGSLKLRSEPGQGTTVVASLPSPKPQMDTLKRKEGDHT